ncbi:MAG: hypothetical protein JWO46_3186 [Nocardioidaceae bacterium]|nr:hypothetical protein [Nocardioidaceae bacterium]
MTGPPQVVRATDDVGLACWDAGGDGEPVVLLHAAFGSGELWAPQLLSFDRAGFRPIAFSRRGHFGSDAGAGDPGRIVDDLEAVADGLDLDTFHLVGTALGGFGAVDFALSRPQRLRSLTVASSLAGVTDPDFVSDTRRLITPEWERLPVEVRELSADYRFRNPEGVAEWRRLTARAVHTTVRQRTAATVTRAALSTISVPTLFVTGDADPYLPPSRMRDLCVRIPHARSEVVVGAGHSPSWECPTRFDDLVLTFIAASSA